MNQLPVVYFTRFTTPPATVPSILKHEYPAKATFAIPAQVAKLEDLKERVSESSFSSNDAPERPQSPGPRMIQIQVPRLRDLNPITLFNNNFSYQQLPTDSRNGSRNGSPFTLRPLKDYRFPSPIRAGERLRHVRMPSLTRMCVYTALSLFTLLLLIGGGVRHHREVDLAADYEPFAWQQFTR